MGDTVKEFILFVKDNPLMLGLCITIVLLFIILIIVLFAGGKKEKNEKTQKLENTNQLFTSEIDNKTLKSTSELNLNEMKEEPGTLNMDAISPDPDENPEYDENLAPINIDEALNLKQERDTNPNIPSIENTTSTPKQFDNTDIIPIPVELNKSGKNNLELDLLNEYSSSKEDTPVKNDSSVPPITDMLNIIDSNDNQQAPVFPEIKDKPVAPIIPDAPVIPVPPVNIAPAAPVNNAANNKDSFNNFFNLNDKMPEGTNNIYDFDPNPPVNDNKPNENKTEDNLVKENNDISNLYDFIPDDPSPKEKPIMDKELDKQIDNIVDEVNSMKTSTLDINPNNKKFDKLIDDINNIKTNNPDLGTISDTSYDLKLNSLIDEINSMKRKSVDLPKEKEPIDLTNGFDDDVDLDDIELPKFKEDSPMDKLKGESFNID